MTTWAEEVARLTDELAGQGLGKSAVAAIGAGLDDLDEGLRKLLTHLTKAAHEDNTDNIVYAQVELDDHLIPHLKALSDALREYARLRGLDEL